MAARTDRTRSEAWDTILQEIKANTNQTGSNTDFDSKQKSQIEESLFFKIFFEDGKKGAFRQGTAARERG